MAFIFTVFLCLGSLPEELQQKLKRIRDLNEKNLEITRASDRMQSYLLNNFNRMSRSEQKKYENVIQQKLDKIKRYSDEIVKEADDAYKLVRLFKLCMLL